MEIRYKINSAGVEDILSHLMASKNSFIPALDQRVDISEYAHKIKDKAITFEAWSNMKLVGLVAAYLNNKKQGSGFITSISILEDYQRQGISSVLLKQCIEYAREKEFNELTLEVSEENAPALHLYTRQGFTIFENKNSMVTMKLGLQNSNN